MLTRPAINGREHIPFGENLNARIYSEDVTVMPDNEAAPEFSDQAAATLVWQNYQAARSYLENNSWLLEWQYTDTLYQSPTLDRSANALNSRVPRVPRFLVAKITNTMSRQVKRAIFAEQIPFFLRPTGDTTQAMCDAWTALIMKLLERMNFKYNTELAIDCQTKNPAGKNQRPPRG
jgi:hypothetical protein